MIVSNGVAGMWALGAQRWAPFRRPALWWFTAAAEVSVLVQIVLGVLLVAAFDRTVDQLHTFYGFLSMVAVMLIYAYRTSMGSRRYLLFGFGGLVIMGLGLRALLVRR